MSSLAASRADNFYFPPDWRPEYGGISKFQGSKGANQYQQAGIIRFELPFDGWCGKCDRHLAKGTRFNAKKDNCGKYFSTTLYSFEMKCPSCSQLMIIKTDPKNRTYDYTEGIRKMEHDYDVEDAVGESTLVIESHDETRLKLSTDPMFKLQHEHEDMSKASSVNRHLEQLIKHRDEFSKLDYDRNCDLRKIVRNKKRKIAEEYEEGEKKHVSYPLLPLSADDRREKVDIKRGNSQFVTNERTKFTAIQNQSIFGGSALNMSKGALKHHRMQSAMLKKSKYGISVRSDNVKKKSLHTK